MSTYGTAVEATLTRGELERPFLAAQPDLEPLPRPTRTGVVWEADAWTEIDPTTGAVLATGAVQDARR